MNLIRYTFHNPLSTNLFDSFSRIQSIILLMFAIFTFLLTFQLEYVLTAREKLHTNRYQAKQRDFDGFCELEIRCKGEDNTNISLPIRLPIRGQKGPQGYLGLKGERGIDGHPGMPGPSSLSAHKKKVAFFVGLTENFGPVPEHTDIIFDRVLTNVGSGYNPATGKFTAPVSGVYQFNVIISAQGRQKAAVMILKNGDMVATVWAESIPYWASSSNVAVLSLEKGDQVWLLLLTRASYLHGYMYSTFSGIIVFEQ